MFSECQKTLVPALPILLHRFNVLNIQKYTALSSLDLRSCQRQQRKSSGVDLMAAFTNGLLEKSTKDWQRKQAKRKTDHKQIVPRVTSDQTQQTPYQSLLERINSLCSDLDIRTLPIDQLNELILNALESKDRATFGNVVEQCVRYNVLPSTAVLLRILPLLCVTDFDNSMKVTSKLIRMCVTHNAQAYEEYPALRPFHAQLLWCDGNSTEALTYLKSIYKCTEPNEKRNICDTYRRIVDDTVLNRGEAVLVNLVGHAVTILDTFNDAAVLQYIWMRCITSQMFCDQQLATELFQNHQQLRHIVRPRLGVMVFKQLEQNDADVVHRLIEQFLAFDMKVECGICMEILFQYQYGRNDMRACSEIMTNALELDITLSKQCGDKLLEMLLRKPQNPTPPMPPPKYNLKF